ncbi:hypothetical protein KJ877_01230 [bacterium]|nr:hypothetical protein [bacterium]MBU1989885.1 hypothetical protein [bacterium]
MKYRLLLSLLFIVATVFTAVHEIKHVEHHESSTCQVCIVDDHSVSFDIVDDFKETQLFKHIYISSYKIRSSPHAINKSNNSRAPPLVS